MRVSAHRPRRFIAVLVSLVALALSLTVISRPIVPARADSQDVSIPVAIAEAADTGQPVLATAVTTETSTVTANPDGTLTAAIGAGPMQEPDPSSSTGWSPIDLSLQHVDGTYAPAVAAADTTFSDGGTGALATLDDGSTTYTENWDGTLPTPTVSGTTATYANVLPNIDLVMQAQTTGFKQSFVVKVAPTQQLVLDVPLSLRGLTATVDDSGTLIVTDAQDNVVATAGTAVMYGAAMDSSGEPTISAVVDTAVVNGQHGPVFEISPDQAFFSTPGLTYPVVIDPSPNLSATTDTYVRYNTATTTYLTDSALKVGTNDGSDKMRALLKFPTIDSSVTGSANPVVVSAATLELYQFDANSCTATEVDAYDAAADWITGSGVTWSNQPSIGTLYAKVSATYGKASSSCSSGGWDAISTGGANGHALKDVVQAWADGTAANNGLIVKAASETDSTYWKKFRSTEYGSNMPYLAVTYTILPAITLSVTTGPPTTSLTVSGTYFAGNESVTVSYSDPSTSFGTATTSAVGAFTKTVTIPADAPPGTQTITATGTSDSAVTPFNTNTDWAQFHYSESKQGVNNFENQVIGGNVAILETVSAFQTQQDSQGNADPINGSPAVVFNKVLGHTAVYVADKLGSLYQLDSADMRTPVWTASIGSGPITASPAVSNSLVYEGSETGWIYAVNTGEGGHTGGAVNWSQNLSAGAIDTSATFYSGFLYVGTANGKLFALWPTTQDGHQGGATRWSFPANPTNDPVVGGAAVVGSNVYFVTAGGILYSLNRETGAENWFFDLQGSVQTTPAVAVLPGETHATIYVTTGLIGSNPHVKAISETDNVNQPALRWNLTLSTVTHDLKSSPALDFSSELGPMLIFGTPAGSVCAVNASGSNQMTSVEWSYRVPGSTFSVDSSPIVSGGITSSGHYNTVFVGAEDGRMYGIRERNGVPIWNSVDQVDKQNLTGSAAVSNGALYFTVSIGNDPNTHLPTRSKVFEYKPRATDQIGVWDTDTSDPIAEGGCD